MVAKVCPPDPHLTCQLPARLPSAGGPAPQTKLVRRATRIANARGGNLFLCPADGLGIIGGLLMNLRYPQRFSHMGVFVDDGLTIRHSTVVQDQMTAKKHMTGSILGQPAPTDGFMDDAIRYGWPGTITQTVDDAFHQLPGAVSYKDADGGIYDVAELSFTTVQATDGELLTPVVVRPCQESTEVADVLNVVAAAVKEINGHYRFYAYTDAGIALDPAKAGPAMSVRRQISGTWWEQNSEAVDPGDPCNANRHPPRSSIPVVCSTLPWAAIQQVNQGKFLGRSSRDWGRHYSIQLDTGPSRMSCPQLVKGDPRAHVVDSSTADGLVVFDEAQRAAAASWFHDALATKVRNELAAAVPGWLTAAAIGVGLVLDALTSGASALLVAAGIAADDADGLIELATQMEEQVANQLCNAFANDDAGNGIGGRDWQQPGIGRSVGPDDTAWFWSPPGGFDPKVPNRMHGLYGRNEPAALRRWDWAEEVSCVWRESDRDNEVEGFVRRDDGSGLVPVPGATVEFACRTFMTDGAGRFAGLAPEGIYLVNASWTDPASGYVWESPPNELDIQVPGMVEIVLQPPPAALRRIDIYGTIDLVDKVAIGHDAWAHVRPSDTAFLGPYSRLNPDPGERDEGKTWTPRSPYGAHVADEVSCSVDLALAWNDDLSIDVTLDGALKEGSDSQATHVDTRRIDPEDSHTFSFTLDSGGPWPNRATVKLTLDNHRQS
jgi:hypothetical protein